MLNDRCIKILNTLESAQDYVPCTTLASDYHVSTRTIRNDIIKIEDFLLEHHLPAFDRNHNNGIRLMYSPILHNLLQTLQMDSQKYVYKKEEIRTFMILKMLYEQEPVLPKYFEDIFQVSRSTIFNIMNEVPQYIYDKRIQLVKIKKIGSSLTSHAIYKIQEFSNQVLNRCDLAQFYDFIESVQADSNSPTKSFLSLVLDQNLSFYLKNYIVKIETELCKTFDDGSFIRVLIFLEKMISNKLGYVKETSHDEMPMLLEKNEYQVACHVINDLHNEFAFQSDGDTQTSLALLLLMSKSETGTSSEGPFLDLSYRLIQCVEKHLLVSIPNQDDLAHFLALHIQPMIYRYKTNIHLENPLFLQIISDYEDIYEAVRSSVEIIERKCQIVVSDHEVSFIALHFVSSMMKDVGLLVKKKRIAVICVEGIAISHKIANAIKKNFDVEITQVIALRNLNNGIIQENDFIIANIDLPIHTRKFIRITSEMNANDMQLLKKAFHQKKDDYHNLAKVENLLSAIKKWCTIKDLEGLQVEILQVMKETTAFADNGVKSVMNFDKDCIATNVECSTWEQAIQAGCNLLLKKNWINQCYEEKIIQNTSEFGGYMVVAPSVMLAHAGVEDGVYSNCLSIVTLKKGVDLNNQYHLPIRMVITMGVTDEKSHLTFLNELMEMINNKTSVQKMLSMDCVAEIYRYWKNNIQF